MLLAQRKKQLQLRGISIYNQQKQAKSIWKFSNIDTKINKGYHMIENSQLSDIDEVALGWSNPKSEGIIKAVQIPAIVNWINFRKNSYP